VSSVGDPAVGTRSTAALSVALGGLRSALDRTALPLLTPGRDRGAAECAELLAQLDDYLLPRLRQIDAPLLTVVGGSTGAGKSTLVNSLVGAVVTQPGVLRPTTRAPVLVCNPADLSWFSSSRVLPSLARATGGRTDGTGTLQLVQAAAVPAGLAFIDAPDIDSVVTANRELANQLLAAADLWLFVTTAARYADAVPWDVLQTAHDRGTSLAVVLDRVPDEAADEVGPDLARLLSEHDLAEAPLFVIAESRRLGADGRLPVVDIQPVRSWFEELAADAGRRAAVVRRTLSGALASVPHRVAVVAHAVGEQRSSAVALAEAAETSYAAAAAEIDDGIRDGSMLRGEVLARWQELVGTGELLRNLESGVGRLRDRVVALVRGRPQPGRDLEVALESGVVTLVRSAAARAAERTAVQWRAMPAGADLLAEDSHAALGEPALDFTVRATDTVHDWQGAVLDLVRTEGQSRRSTARFLSFGLNGTSLIVMVAVFASTGGLTGAELLIAGGTSALSQKLLEALFGDQAVRRLASAAREDLRERAETLLSAERARFVDALPTGLPEQGDAERLRLAAAAVESST